METRKIATDKYSYEYIVERIDALKRNGPIQPFNNAMYEHTFKASLITLITNHIARASDLSEEEKTFFSNFISKKERELNNKQSNVDSRYYTHSNPDSVDHLIRFYFDEEFSPKQAEKVINFYQQYYDAHNISYYQGSGKLVFDINLDIFLNNTLEDMLNNRLGTELKKSDSSQATFTSISHEEEAEKNLPPQRQLINKVARILETSPKDINDSEKFETRIVKLAANLPGLSENDKKFFADFDASKHACFRTEEAYNRTVITISDGLLTKKQAEQVAEFYSGHFDNTQTRYVQPYNIGMYEPSKTIITLDFDVLMKQILPAIENISLLPTMREQPQCTLQEIRYK